MDVEIRRLGPGDGHVLDRVAAEVFDEPVRPDRLAAYLAQLLLSRELGAPVWPPRVPVREAAD